MFINAKFLLQIILMNCSKKRELFNGNLNSVLCQYHYDIYNMQKDSLLFSLVYQ